MIFNVSVKKIFAWGPKVDQTIVEVSDGKLSYGSGKPIPVSQLDSPRGGYFVVDGHHRIVEAILNGKSQISAVIDANIPRIERTGGAHHSFVAAKVNVYERVKGGRENPFVAMHPDLFPQKPHSGDDDGGLVQALRDAGAMLRIPPNKRVVDLTNAEAERLAAWKRGETPMFAKLADLTSEQIRELPRSAFTNDEWDELDEDDVDYIEEHDEESRGRVDDLAGILISRYRWEARGEDRDYSDIETGLEYHIQSQGDHLWEDVPSKIYDEVLKYAENLAIPAEEVNRIFNELLSDTNNYDIETNSYGGGFYSEEIHGNVYIDKDDFADQMAACTPDELVRAAKKIYEETDDVVDIDFADVVKGDKKYWTGDWSFNTGQYMVATVKNWDHLEQQAREAIDEIEIPDDKDRHGELPPEERVVFRWPDGFYVQDLLPSELPLEGKTMGMCVGRPDMGYGKAVRSGECKILSLRRPSGKPLFTIEEDIRDDSSSIDQVKGKANRLPGFDLGKASAVHLGSTGAEAAHQAALGLKRDEVERVIDFLESIDIDPTSVDDLWPALVAIALLNSKGDPWAKTIAPRIPGLNKKLGDEAKKQNPAACATGHGSDCTGFCLPYRRRR